MAENMTNPNEALVLNDGQGSLYAIPRQVLEQHRVMGDERAEIERLWGEGVSGFRMNAPMVDPSISPKADVNPSASSANLLTGFLVALPDAIVEAVLTGRPLPLKTDNPNWG